ncbi:MAG: hypothetical protein ACI9DC_004548 [Gammaproteobacteria bacterium]|jgi:hypothetical protein
MNIDAALTAIFGPYLAALIGFALAFVLFAYMLCRHQRQSASIAWFLFVVLLPFIGVPLYLLLAGRKLAKRAAQKQRLQGSTANESVKLRGTAEKVENIMRSYDLFSATNGNRTELITNGERAYLELMTQISAATASIHITTFILGRDEVGRAIVKRLAQRASEGIDVRLLVDALGSFTARFVLLSELQRAGGKTGSFMRVLPFHRKSKANLRNHRKLAIFDERIAIAGGMNLAKATEHDVRIATPKVVFQMMANAPTSAHPTAGDDHGAAANAIDCHRLFGAFAVTQSRQPVGESLTCQLVAIKFVEQFNVSLVRAGCRDSHRTIKKHLSLWQSTFAFELSPGVYQFLSTADRKCRDEHVACVGVRFGKRNAKFLMGLCHWSVISVTVSRLQQDDIRVLEASRVP